MATTPVTQQVLIEFITDTTQLASSTDRLEQMGVVEKKNADSFKASTTELNKQVKAISDINAASAKAAQAGMPLKKTIIDINNAVKGLGASLLKDLKQGANEALQQAGVSAAEFEAALEGATVQSVSLKAQLREMVAQLQVLELQGQDNTEQYKRITAEATRLKKAINDVNDTLKSTSSDTANLDGLIGIASGVAGGFAVAQGAAALFGDESEELQKTLLRVNAAMAILQGLQQIQVVLQKESAAATLANTIATRAQTIAQTAYNIIVGSTVGVLKAFRVALAATGVGLFIIAIYELYNAFKSTNDELEVTNNLLETQANLISAINEDIDNRVSLEEAQANAVGAAQSEIIKIQGRGLIAQRKALTEQNALFAQQRSELDQTSEAYAKLNNQIEANNKAIGQIDVQTQIKALDLQRQIADERTEAAKKANDAAKKAAEDAASRAKELRAAGFADFKAGVELRLLAAKEGSEEELNIRKELLRATLQVELDNEKLTQNQRKLLIQQYFKDRVDAEKKFASDREKLILENIASDIQAEIQGLELSNERRLELNETAINLAAEMEINAANNNAAKISEINARRDKAIRDARIASINEVVNYEIALATAANGPATRRLKIEADNDKIRLSQRIDAVNQLEAIESAAIQKRVTALNTQFSSGLISQKDYNLQYAQLVDQQTVIWEDAEKKRTDITVAESEKRKQQTIEDIQLIVDVASEVVGVLDALFQLQATKENNDLARRKQQLEELKAAGAITEKEAISRQKRLEAWNTMP